MNTYQNKKRLKELLGERAWKKLTEEGRDKLLEKYESEYDKDTTTVSKTIRLIRQYYFNQGFLVIGVVLGILGSFLVSAIDRLELIYFGQDNVFYDVAVIVVSVGLLLLVLRGFDKINEEILRSNKYIDSLFEKSGSSGLKKDIKK